MFVDIASILNICLPNNLNKNELNAKDSII